MEDKVKVKIEGNTIKFLEGGPKIAATLNAWIKAITLCPLDEGVADKELAKVKVESVAKFNVPLPSSEYFLADLDSLLSFMTS